MLLQLIYFRISFGILLFFLVGRYFAYGWIDEYFINIQFNFPHFGWEFLKPLPPIGMLVLFSYLGVLSLCIIFGIAYRFSCIAFSLLFAYQHLLDRTNFLNHYYLVFLLCILASFLPLEKDSIVYDRIKIKSWHIWIIRFQLGIVYFYGSLAKCKTDWMMNAEPLRIWLLMNRDLPLIGNILTVKLTPYLFSYAGFLFDLFIFPLLLQKKTFKFAYLLVLIFHILTNILFPIGMFPFLMIFLTPICFPSREFHKIILKFMNSYKIFLLKISFCKYSLNKNGLLFLDSWNKLASSIVLHFKSFLTKYNFLLLKRMKRDHFLISQTRIQFSLSYLWRDNIFRDAPGITKIFFIIYFTLQLLLPFRYLLYPGNLLWTEEGFNFSWHIMIAHKSGYVDFFARDKVSGFKEKLNVRKLLTTKQWAQMKTDPIMIYQFAQFIGKLEREKGRRNFGITVDSAVSLNGHPFHALIREDIDLLEVEFHLFRSNPWISRDWKD